MWLHFDLILDPKLSFVEARGCYPHYLFSLKPPVQTICSFVDVILVLKQSESDVADPNQADPPVENLNSSCEAFLLRNSGYLAKFSDQASFVITRLATEMCSSTSSDRKS